ncbi:glycoside hydrolase family 3 protein [Wocania ichthyoenteri]|uniref:glycoside hydrolase family 3 protein n=1 Tax=Wocania ichthyoenteri TaxID=1230531 RepID=UPI00068C9C60|nr:glycoside hydrolase family 3 N-terminal domain-containing protein [Wocania ichthyoenteri]
MKLNYWSKIIVIVFSGIYANCFGQNQKADIDFLSKIKDNDKWVDGIMKSLSPRERIAQLFFIQAYSDRDESYVDSLMNEVGKDKVGGIIFFQGGPERQAKLTNKLQKNSKVPLIISMDAEWGMGMRLDSISNYPYQMTLGAISDNQLINDMGTAIGEQMNRLGVHINLAPVVDVNNNPDNPVINFRSFGSNKYNVTEKSYQYMIGLHSKNILANIKHFPGHGDTNTDSHLDLPVLTHDMKRMDSLELFPFKNLINKGAGSVMVAHLNVPNLQKNKKNIPSTLSPEIIKDLLKSKLGFKGLVFTDALNMKGVTKYFAPGDIEVKALLAGNDVLLFSEDINLGINKIEEAVKAGIISQDVIDSKCKSVLKLKKWVGLDSMDSINIDGLHDDLNNVKYTHITRKLFEHAITTLSNKDNAIPMRNLDSLKIASLSVGVDSLTIFQKRLSKHTDMDHYLIPYNSSLKETDSILNKLKSYDKVILGIHSESVLSTDDYGIADATTRIVHQVCADNQTIVVAFLNAYALKKFDNLEQAESIVLTYQNHDFLEETSADMIFGKSPSLGTLPFDIDSRYKSGIGIIIE